MDKPRYLSHSYDRVCLISCGWRCSSYWLPLCTEYQDYFDVMLISLEQASTTSYISKHNGSNYEYCGISACMSYSYAVVCRLISSDFGPTDKQQTLASSSGFAVYPCRSSKGASCHGPRCFCYEIGMISMKIRPELIESSLSIKITLFLQSRGSYVRGTLLVYRL